MTSLQDQFHHISIMTTHVPSTIYNLTYNAQLYLTIYQWLAGLQWLIFAIKLALIILNKWMDWFKMKNTMGVWQTFWSFLAFK